MFSELLSEPGFRSSHLPRNRSVRRENGPHFDEEEIKILGDQGLAKVTQLVLAKGGRNSGLAPGPWHFLPYHAPSSDITRYQ